MITATLYYIQVQCEPTTCVFMKADDPLMCPEESSKVKIALIKVHDVSFLVTIND